MQAASARVLNQAPVGFIKISDNNSASVFFKNQSTKLSCPVKVVKHRLYLGASNESSRSSPPRASRDDEKLSVLNGHSETMLRTMACVHPLVHEK